MPRLESAGIHIVPYVRAFIADEHPFEILLDPQPEGIVLGTRQEIRQISYPLPAGAEWPSLSL